MLVIAVPRAVWALVDGAATIAGHSAVGAGGQHAVHWRNGQIIDLGMLNGNPTHAYAINDHGQIAGTSTTPTGELRGFLWENGVVTRLGAPGISSGAETVNDRGEIVGRYTLDGERGTRPVRWYQAPMTELGLLARGADGAAVAINGQGQILGTSNVAPHRIVEHAFLWWRGAFA